MNMEDVVIRKFRDSDVDDFIRLSEVSFSEESIAAGITPQDFERETRKIFRWKMIPYKLLTMLMNIKWEGFVAEKGEKVVGGAMFMGKKDHMVLSNLMVDPEYRRQGIGQTLLIKRLERLAELGYLYATTEVLETNSASIGNIKKRGFELFNSYSVYESALPLQENQLTANLKLDFQEIKPSDRTVFHKIEKQTTPQFLLKINGSAEDRFFLSRWQKLYLRYIHSSKWIKALSLGGEIIGFICVDFQQQQSKGFLIKPVISEKGMSYLADILQGVATWLTASGRLSMVIEISDRWTCMRDYVLEHGWRKQYTWLEFIKWLDDRAKQETLERFPIQVNE
jgi:ribosomal protein S18 acetylase RimI-like enzyme